MSGVVEFDPTAFENFSYEDQYFNESPNKPFDDGDDDASPSSKRTVSVNRTATILAIDVSCGEKILFGTTDDGGQSRWVRIVEFILSFLKSRLIATDSDMVAVWLVGTQIPNNSLNFKGIHELQELGFLEAMKIQKMTELVKAGENSFKARFGTSTEDTEYKISDIFWMSSLSLSAACKKPFVKKLIFYTFSDYRSMEKSALESCVTRASDLKSENVEVSVFPISTEDSKEFDHEYFWNQIVSNPDQSIVPIDPRLLIQKSRTYESSQRVMLNTKWKIVDGMEISVSIYKPVSQAKPRLPISLDAKSNVIVKTDTKWICKRTGEILQPCDRIRFFEYGGERIIVSPQEKEFCLNPGGFVTGISLLGFKDFDKVKKTYSLTATYLVRPNEKLVSGSSVLFSSLLNSCKTKNLVAIVRWYLRKSSFPRVAALIPHVENEGKSSLPVGFYAIPLPFSEEIRRLDLSDSTIISPEATEQEKALAVEDRKQRVPPAVEIINSIKLKQPFSECSFPNPVIQQHYAGLECLALGEEELRVVSEEFPYYDHKSEEIQEKFQNFNQIMEELPDYVTNKRKPKSKAKSKSKAKAKAKGKSKKDDSASED